MELCADVVRKARGRLAVPTYDLRFGNLASLRLAELCEAFVVASLVRACYNPPAPVRARFRRAFIDMNQYQYRKLTELVLFLAKNTELIEKAIYLLFVMLN